MHFSITRACLIVKLTTKEDKIAITTNSTRISDAELSLAGILGWDEWIDHHYHARFGLTGWKQWGVKSLWKTPKTFSAYDELCSHLSINELYSFLLWLVTV